MPSKKKPQKAVAKKHKTQTPGWDKEAFLKAALPIVGLTNKRQITVAIGLSDEGLMFETDKRLAQHVIQGIYHAKTLAEFRYAIHEGIKQLTKVMELTM